MELVQLTDVRNKKFRKFSLGMKQRLGIAFAVLDNPDLIILDACVIIGLNQRKPYKSRVTGLSPIILDRKIGTLTLPDNYLCSAA